MAEERNEAARVRLLVYSGRPDPTWDLDLDQARSLSERVARVTNGEKYQTAPIGGLGYRGFLVQRQNKSIALPEQLIVFQHVVTIGAVRNPTYWRDTEGIEELLIQQARERGYGDVLDWAAENGSGENSKTQ